MELRPLQGSVGWREASMVLHIPNELGALHFGAMSTGGEVLRATQFKRELAPDSVPEAKGPRA
jgi:hypothetical protein